MIELTSKQLRRAAGIKDKIESLQGELNRLLGGTASKPAAKASPKRRKLSAAVRARMSAAAKARWTKIKAGKK